MHLLCPTSLTLLFLVSLVTPNPVANPKPAPDRVLRSLPSLVKRVGLGPSPYPYGNGGLNEFSWHEWDPNDSGQKSDAVKIHNAYNDMTNMVAFAWREADSKTETFKRWFDEADADNVKKVLEKVVSSQGVQQPTVLMKDWICEQNDVKGACRPTTNAYSVSNKGQFHLCPPGVAQPNAADLKCSDLDGFPSAKMKSVAFTMLHEVTHWTKVGDDALGKHITDKANGASDCINLSPADKLINAQNYAFLGAEAYFKVKQCAFTDPPPGTRGTDDTADDLSVDPSTYSPGWCGIHVKQYQKNEPGFCSTCNSPDYILSVCVYDGKQVLLNQFPGSDPSSCAVFVAPNGGSQPIDTALPYLLYVSAGAVDDDPIKFSYGDQEWDSNNQEHHSNFGAYDSGSRNGDSGFSC
ncbi:MAG: hypothetical protein LQ338_007691 [Usnochroma carphineum]|nr:MAG: hypothetical protein LQ338_007691 [Usnochroma carphineum]